MNETPASSNEPDELDEQYRRLSACDSSAPSERVRAAVLTYAAELAVSARAGQGAGASPAKTRIRWRAASYGGLAAAAALAGLLTVPHFLPRPAAPAAPAEHPRTALSAPQPPSSAPAQALRPADVQTANEPPAFVQNSRAERRASAALDRPASAAASAPRAADVIDPGAALREAAQRGDVPAVQRLAAEKANIDARDADGRTALMLAVLNGRARAVDALLAAGADPNAADANGTTPLQAALAGAHSTIATALEQSGAR
jgi:hypothetical protein